MGGFQQTVNQFNPLGVEGDFAGLGPRHTVLAGDGAFVAGPNGVIVGRYAFVLPDGRTVTNGGGGALKGFVHRDMQALVTVYLAAFSMTIAPGFPVTLFDAGDFLARLAAGNAVVPGSTLYARYSDGAITSTLPTGASVTASSGATFTATGTVDSLVVTAVTGLISIGDTIAGTGVPAGTSIIAQVSGTAGGAGTYTTSGPTTAAAATVTSFGSVLDVTAEGSGVLAVGDVISGTGIPTGAAISSQVSGAPGGIGVYTIDIPATAYAASTTVTVVAGEQIKFVAKSSAAVGELVKISTWGN